MKYELLHEATGHEEDLAAKYDVPTFDEYKVWCQEHVRPLVKDWIAGKGPQPPLISERQDWTAIQELAFTVVYFIHCGGHPPRALIINRKFALKLLEEEGKVPKEFEGIPLAFDEKALPQISSLG